MTQTLHIISGPPGSGKSTFSKKLASIFPKSINIDCDDLYNMVEKGYNNPWELEGGDLVDLMCQTVCSQTYIYANAGFDVVINYVFELRELKYLLTYIGENQININLYILLPCKERLVEQDKNREFVVGEDRVSTYHQKFVDMIENSPFLKKHAINQRVNDISKLDLNSFKIDQDFLNQAKNSENINDIIVAEPNQYKMIGDLMYESRKKLIPFIRHNYSKESFYDFIKNNVAPEFKIMIHYQDNIITGFVAYGSGWIEHLYLAPEYIDQGIGKKLLKYALSDVEDEMQLWTFKENQRAVEFYKKNGFKIVEESSKNEENVPALRMILKR